MVGYSKSFNELIQSPQDLHDLLINSSFSGSFEGWERRKKFIAAAINKSGTILDVGCGNGFLLRCLQEWSSYDLDPYGIDINSVYIEKAKQLYPDIQSHFAVQDVNELDEQIGGLPYKFDFVFFSSDWTHAKSANALIETLPMLVSSGGRLILGFYSEDRNNNLKAVEKIRSEGLVLDKIIENPNDSNLVAWSENFQ